MTRIGDRVRVTKRGQRLPGLASIYGFSDMGRPAARPNHLWADNVHAITTVGQGSREEPGFSAIAGISHSSDHATRGHMQLIQKARGHNGLICIVYTQHTPGSRWVRWSWSKH